MQDNLTIEGTFSFTLFDKNGKLKLRAVQKNRILQNGLNLVAGLLANTSSYRLKGIGIGSGVNTVTVNDTILTSPVWKDVTFVSSTNKIHGIALFGTSEANQEINEFGVRDTNNILFSRSLNTISRFTKENGETLSIRWDLDIEHKLGI